MNTLKLTRMPLCRRQRMIYRVWPGNWRVVQLLPGAHVRVVALGDESLPPEELPMA
jgi:hypothetical protein